MGGRANGRQNETAIKEDLNTGANERENGTNARENGRTNEKCTGRGVQIEMEGTSECALSAATVPAPGPRPPFDPASAIQAPPPNHIPGDEDDLLPLAAVVGEVPLVVEDGVAALGGREGLDLVVEVIVAGTRGAGLVHDDHLGVILDLEEDVLVLAARLERQVLLDARIVHGHTGRLEARRGGNEHIRTVHSAHVRPTNRHACSFPLRPSNCSDVPTNDRIGSDPLGLGRGAGSQPAGSRQGGEQGGEHKRGEHGRRAGRRRQEASREGRRLPLTFVLHPQTRRT